VNWVVFDTEATNCPMVDGKLDVKNGQVYDLGAWVINDAGEKLDHISLINGDVFFRMPDAMREAYYAEKIPQYMKDIWDGKRTVVNTWGMWKAFAELCKKWDVVGAVAHNAHFDRTVLNATIRYQTKSKKRYFLPFNLPLVDSLKIAQNTICKSADYIAFCEANGYMTNHATPRPRATAEVLWKYLTQNNDFVEEHTGLSDAEIEATIFLKCHQYGVENCPNFLPAKNRAVAYSHCAA